MSRSYSGNSIPQYGGNFNTFSTLFLQLLPSSRGETVEEACAVHGVDVEKLLEAVNAEANK